jgi:hypothetical protein
MMPNYKNFETNNDMMRLTSRKGWHFVYTITDVLESKRRIIQEW